MTTALLLNHDHMGHGDADLGARILRTFLQKSLALGDLDAVLLVNGGVTLTAADSSVRAELALLEERGVDVVPCGTCLEHFGVSPAMGSVSSMDDIVAALGRAAMVITL